MAAPSDDALRKLRAYYRGCGERLRERRGQIDMSLAQLAILTGFSRKTIWRLEQGTAPWTHKAACTLAPALECSAEWLRPTLAEPL